MNEKELFAFLASNGVRIFALSIGSHCTHYIHPNKTVGEWRADVRRFISEIGQVKDKEGYADDDAFNALTGKLHDSGYFDVDDMVADVYEGRVAKQIVSIVDDPAHDEQADGFGHYGLESKSEI